MLDRESLIERCPRVAELDDATLERLNLMIGYVDESVGIDHLVNCLADNASAGGDGIIRCYVGFEPSGKAHIGWKVISLQMKRMLDAGAKRIDFPCRLARLGERQVRRRYGRHSNNCNLHGRNLQSVIGIPSRGRRCR